MVPTMHTMRIVIFAFHLFKALTRRFTQYNKQTDHALKIAHVCIYKSSLHSQVQTAKLKRLVFTADVLAVGKALRA